MDLELERKTRGCFTSNCPARYRVVGAPGGTVFVGKKLDEETRAQLEGQIGPDEYAVWVPDDL
jgi:hypothetical protein